MPIDRNRYYVMVRTDAVEQDILENDVTTFVKESFVRTFRQKNNETLKIRSDSNWMDRDTDCASSLASKRTTMIVTRIGRSRAPWSRRIAISLGPRRSLETFVELSGRTRETLEGKRIAGVTLRGNDVMALVKKKRSVLRAR